MRLDEINSIIQDYLDGVPTTFSIKKEIFTSSEGRGNYNEIIKHNVKKKSGIYLWLDKDNNLLYVGMAGKINNSGKVCDHSLRHRLLASRGKNKETKKDILTNDYISSIMATNQLELLNFCIFYLKPKIPASYVEVLILYKYYECNQCLPKFNKFL